MALTLTIGRDAFLAAVTAASAIGAQSMRLRVNGAALELGWSYALSSGQSAVGGASVGGATGIGGNPSDSTLRAAPLLAGLTAVTAAGNVTIATTEGPPKWVLTWGANPAYSLAHADEQA